jgi:hypothetical protein
LCVAREIHYCIRDELSCHFHNAQANLQRQRGAAAVDAVAYLRKPFVQQLLLDALDAACSLALWQKLDADGIGTQGARMLMRLVRRGDHLGKGRRESIIAFPPPFHDDSRRFPGRRNSGVWVQPCFTSNPNSQ